MIMQFNYMNLECQLVNVLNFMKSADKQCIKYLKDEIVSLENN